MSERVETADKSCAVCGRNLLIGERASAYVSREGAEVTVCELCKARAESAGWLRPEQAAVQGGAEAGGRRRRRRGELLGGLLQRPERERPRRRSGGASGDERGERDRRPAEVAEERVAAEPAPVEAPAQSGSGGRDSRSAAGPDLQQAVAAFNASENRRTIAGLSRSLGQPRATAIAIRTSSGHTGARLTVAWDLTWYQWEIGPGKRGPQVRQTAKGDTVDQLRAADRNWNLTMAEDGSLARPPRTTA